MAHQGPPTKHAFHMAGHGENSTTKVKQQTWKGRPLRQSLRHATLSVLGVRGQNKLFAGSAQGRAGWFPIHSQLTVATRENLPVPRSLRSYSEAKKGFCT